jgi:serine protease
MKMLVAILTALLALPAFGQTQQPQGPLRSPIAADTDQIIVKWRSDAKATQAAPGPQKASKLSARSGLGIQHKRRGSGGTDIFKLERRMSGAQLQAVLDRLNADPDVAYAVADKWRRIQQIPTDPMAADQWYFMSVQPAATRTDQAWDLTTGSASTVVAVLDTGVRFDHPDLTSKLLPGYDFVTDPRVANDNDGPDPDASDPGDWIAPEDRNIDVFRGCAVGQSTWHGTRVASLIGASANDGVGMTGAGWATRILPVRVLGKCGGVDSDIIDGMRWAAGLPVEGAPTNPTPAQIINMSLGGDDACSAAYQEAVDEIIARGVLIVASVGNEGIPVGTPANCRGVLGVAGVRHTGTKVGYSNLGPGADLAAPAGNCVNSPPFTADAPCVFAMTVALNDGETGPLAGGSYSDTVVRPNYGTSFSAPLVSGAAALMHSVNPRLTSAQFTTLLQESAAPFPTSSTSTTRICRVPTTFVQGQECICTTATCGAGLLDTFAAVSAALKPFGVVQANGTIEPNTPVDISAAGSFGAYDATAGASRPITSYQWSVLDVTGATPTIADASAATTTLQVAGNSRFTLRLTVTDDAGGTDDTDFAMVTSTPPEPQTPPTSTPIGTGGGGGSFDWWLLLLGLLPLLLSGPRRRKPLTGSAGRGHRSRRRQHFAE